MRSPERLGEILASLARLQEELRHAVEHGDSSAADQLLSQLAVLERRRNRVVHENIGADAQRLDSTPPLRNQIIAVLGLLGRPASIRLVADVARARFGGSLPTNRIASLRRDEERSWERSPGARPVYVVPALSSDRFAAVRGEIAISSWPLNIRIVGLASPRVDTLQVLDALLAEHAKGPEAGWTRALERVIWRLSTSVPDAIQIGSPIDSRRVRSAIAAELGDLVEADQEERRDAADRAQSQLDAQAKLFGARIRVLDGGLAAAGGMK